MLNIFHRVVTCCDEAFNFVPDHGKFQLNLNQHEKGTMYGKAKMGEISFFVMTIIQVITARQEA
jgi:hypothetical protein